MRRALIGHTGFVGGHLAAGMEFDAFYNSSNIASIAGQSFDLVACAGVPAVKWKANKDPEGDWKAIERLLGPLASVEAREFILVSTVDVFDPAVGVDEATPVRTEGLHPYGAHRFRVEEFVRKRFARARVLRLPGLFGKGLKKNVIHDFLTGNDVGAVDHRAVYQFYNLEHLVADLEIMRRADLPLLHLATEPVSVEEVARHAFAREFDNPVSTTPARYDFRTRHAALWGRAGEYQYAKDEVLSEIRDFVARAVREKAVGA